MIDNNIDDKHINRYNKEVKLYENINIIFTGLK